MNDLYKVIARLLLCHLHWANIPAALYNVRNSSWLVWDDGTTARYADIQCQHWWTTGLTVQLADTALLS